MLSEYLQNIDRNIISVFSKHRIKIQNISWNSFEAYSLGKYKIESSERISSKRLVVISNELSNMEGFFIRIFFVCTENPEINVKRITRRYLNGGHEVPISKIVSRYYKSLLNIGKVIPLVDRVYVYDNSVEDQMPKLLYRTVDGQLFKKYVEDIPEWAKLLL